MQQSVPVSRWKLIGRWVWKQFRLDHDYPMPPLEPGESIFLEGDAIFIKGLIGARGGRLILTDRRLMWYEDSALEGPWPLKRIAGQTRLVNVAGVDKGALLDIIFGGRGLRIRLRSGSHRHFWVKYRRFWVDDINTWVASVKKAVSASRRGER